jgi:hypothetical protein
MGSHLGLGLLMVELPHHDHRPVELHLGQCPQEERPFMFAISIEFLVLDCCLNRLCLAHISNVQHFILNGTNLEFPLLHPSHPLCDPDCRRGIVRDKAPRKWRGNSYAKHAHVSHAAQSSEQTACLDRSGSPDG